jgi:hypothetical protein
MDVSGKYEGVILISLRHSSLSNVGDNNRKVGLCTVMVLQRNDSLF